MIYGPWEEKFVRNTSDATFMSMEFKKVPEEVVFEHRDAEPSTTENSGLVEGMETPNGKVQEKVIFFKKKKEEGGRDYHELVKDIILVIHNPRDTYSQELIREVYQGWGRRDFEQLLSELGEDFESRPNEWKIYETQKITRELYPLTHRLEEIQNELAQAVERNKWSGVTYHSLEDKLESARESLDRSVQGLKGMGFVGRLLGDRDKAKNLRANIDYEARRITDLEAKIAGSPRQEREEERRREKEERDSTEVGLRAKIEETKTRIDALRKQLEQIDETKEKE